MTHLSDPYQLIPWIAMLVAKLALCAVLLLNQDRGRNRYPAFRAFIYASTLRSFAVFAIAELGPYWLYWWSHWISEVAIAALRFCVLAELFRQLFHPVKAVPIRIMRVFWISTAAIITAGAIIAVATPSSYPELVMSVAMTAERAALYIQAGTLGLVIIFASYLGVHWRDRAFGISAGLVLEYVISSLVLTILSPTLARYGLLFGIPPFSTTVAVIIWIFYFSRRDTSFITIGDQEADCLLSLTNDTTEPAARGTFNDQLF